MKNKQGKRIWIGLGSLATAAVPIIIATSCSSLLGSSSKYDSENDNNIVIQTTWSTGGAHILSLREVVSKYNELNKNTPGYMKVVVQKVQGGYGTVPSQAITKIKSKDTRTLPNLYIDYPTALGMISPFNMAFDVSDEVSRDLFEKQFVEVNDGISGIKKGGLYIIPLAKSTEALSINKPLLKYLITEVAAKNSSKVVVEKDKTNNPILNGIMKTVISSRDKGVIQKVWGATKSNPIFENLPITGPNAGKFVINDDIFKYYKNINEFSMNLQSAFSTIEKPNVLGYDSVTNSVYTINLIKNKNDKEKFLFTKNKKNGYVDYKFLRNGTNQSKDFKDIYDEYFSKPLDKGSIWVGGGGEYGSNLLKEHKMAISIGSTAGLRYATSWSPQFLNQSEVSYQMPIDRVEKKIILASENNGQVSNWDKIRNIMVQGPSFNTIHINEEENKATKKFLKWFYSKNKTKFQGEKTPITPVDFFSKKSSYIVPMKGAFENDSTIAKSLDLANKTKFEQQSAALMGVHASFKTLQRMINESKQEGINYKVVNTPIDALTGSIRKMIDSQVNASKNNKNNGSTPYNKEVLWGNLKRQAIIDQIIPDDGSLKNKYKYGNMANRNFSDINWDKYSYVDGYVTRWTDGDTLRIQVTNKSNHESLKNIKKNWSINVRISGIDTPESSLKFGEVKFKTINDKGHIAYETMNDESMAAIIKHFKDKRKPLAIKSGRHTNKLSKETSNRYNYWRNIRLSIASIDDNDDDLLNEGTIKLKKKLPTVRGKTTNFRNFKLDSTIIGLDKKYYGQKLFPDSALIEGWYANKAHQFGLKNIPVGSKVRIATTGAKSYNRYVGSLFYGENLKHNYSTNIVKSGWAMPLISNLSSVLDKNSIFWHTGQAIADAFNLAKDSKLGLFNFTGGSLEAHLQKILLSHGLPEIDGLLKNSSSKTNIYKYMEIRKPDPSLYKTERDK